MKSSRYYKITLNESDSTITSEIIKLAALANGGKPVTLSDIETSARMTMITYPTLCKDISVHLIGNTLIIDKGTTNLLVIEEREELELGMPTLSSEEARGILDDNNKEILN
jgi:hypothetical protein